MASDSRIAVDAVNLVGLMGMGSGWACRIQVALDTAPPLSWIGPTCDDRKHAQRHVEIVLAALRSGPAANEPTFQCGRCGAVGEFYEPWQICEDCFAAVYPHLAGPAASEEPR